MIKFFKNLFGFGKNKKFLLDETVHAPKITFDEQVDLDCSLQLSGLLEQNEDLSYTFNSHPDFCITTGIKTNDIDIITKKMKEIRNGLYPFINQSDIQKWRRLTINKDILKELWVERLLETIQEVSNESSEQEPVTEVVVPVTEVEASVTQVEASVIEVDAPIIDVEAPVIDVEAPVTEVVIKVDAPVDDTKKKKKKRNKNRS